MDQTTLRADTTERNFLESCLTLIETAVPLKEKTLLLEGRRIRWKVSHMRLLFERDSPCISSDP